MNTENILKLADFIEGGSQTWGYPTHQCFIGHWVAMNEIPWSEFRDETKFGKELGITDEKMWNQLCFAWNEFHPKGVSMPREDAVLTLRYLANYGKLPTKEMFGG